MKYRAAIFDMDGTILDTIGDLTNAIRYVMVSEGHRADFSDSDTKQFFGSGALVAFARALAFEAGENTGTILNIGSGPDKQFDEEARRLADVFAEYYPSHCEEQTRPFDGLVETLRELRQAGVGLAVVSNKIDSAVQIMTEHYFPGLFDFAAGLDDKIRRKPYPDMVEKCLLELGVERSDAVYIGDSEIDIRTAENTGLDCISVIWGFRSEEFLRKQGADCIIRRPHELTRVIL